uniref:Uncharacterized protein n=1 Tax=Chelonoidis abingdonii TaxID=106734 RepID=A0A8C0QN50_CHEAB
GIMFSNLHYFAFININPRPWHRQDVSANPMAHVGRAGRTKSCCWRATQPGCRCRVARGAWSCMGDTEQASSCSVKWPSRLSSCDPWLLDSGTGLGALTP